jgi:hypothetical protein
MLPTLAAVPKSTLIVVCVWPMRREERCDRSCYVNVVMWIGESKHVGGDMDFDS